MEGAAVAAESPAREETPFLFAPGGTRLIQVQPTQLCNLRCLHCYSESGPDRRGALAGASVAAFLHEARSLGYRYVGVSGGEPLLWRDLDDFLEAAVAMGYSTSVVTNATLLTRERAARLRGRARLVAVSVDGPPADHAAMRGPDAFPRTQRGLAALRDEGVPFALVFTLTRHNVDRLSWLYAFAEEVGALGVEVHPLALSGAAETNLAGDAPESEELQVAAWLLALLVAERGGAGPGVTFDVARRTIVAGCGWPLLGGRRERTASFADLVPSLVVEPDGVVSPFIYGFPRRWSIARLGEGPLAAATRTWRERFRRELAALAHETLRRLAREDAEWIDFFPQLLATARAHGLSHGDDARG